MSLEQFKLAWARTGLLEKGYADNPKDKGGETNFGITEVVARSFGYTGDMKALSMDVATTIAKEAYWDTLLLDWVAEVSEEVADKLFDLAFLEGQPTAVLFFQRLLNVLNTKGDTVLYPELREDMHLGKVTVYAFKLFMQVRAKEGGELVVLRALKCQEGQRFIDAVHANPDNKDSVFGWFLNRVD